MVTRRPHKPEIAGSTPACATAKLKPERIITDDERRLERELDAPCPVMLDACARFVATRTAKAFKAWTGLNAQYVETHRRLWSLTHPDVPYESVFGATAEPPA